MTHLTTLDGEVYQGDDVVATYEVNDIGRACGQALVRALNNGLGPDGDLPETCFGVKPDDESLILLKRGERGYWPAEGYPLGELPSTSVQADYLNARRGVTPRQRAAMEFGSLFGFDVPGADPAKYGADGRLKRK